MIDLEALTEQLNTLAGTDLFLFYLNTNNAPDDRDERTVVTVSCTRVPLSFSTDELDAESLVLTLTFDLTAYNDRVRAKALSRIQTALLGWNNFTVKQYGGTDSDGAEIITEYEVSTFLEQQAPSSPYIDNGGQTQQIIVSGNVTAQNKDSGVIIGNAVKVYLDGVRLLKSTRAAAMQAGTDTRIPLSGGRLRLECDVVSRVSTIQLTCIYTGKDIENTFLQIAEGVDNAENYEFTYKVVYSDDLEIERKVKLLGVNVEDKAGVFINYTLTLQTVSYDEVVGEVEVS